MKLQDFIGKLEVVSLRVERDFTLAYQTYLLYHNPHSISQQDLCQINNISEVSKENIALTFFDEKND